MAIGDSAYKVYSQDQRRGEIDAVPRNKYSFTVSLNYIYYKSIMENHGFKKLINWCEINAPLVS